jgi:hypothetical protein
MSSSLNAIDTLPGLLGRYGICPSSCGCGPAEAIYPGVMCAAPICSLVVRGSEAVVLSGKSHKLG